MGKEERLRKGALGREWVTSDEAMMSAESMGKNLIKNLEVLFEKWVPRSRFTLENITTVPSNYQKYPLPYTDEFKTKIEELI